MTLQECVGQQVCPRVPRAPPGAMLQCPELEGDALGQVPMFSDVIHKSPGLVLTILGHPQAL